MRSLFFTATIACCASPALALAEVPDSALSSDAPEVAVAGPVAAGEVRADAGKPAASPERFGNLPEQHTIVLNHGRASASEIHAKVGDVLHIFHDDSVNSHEFYTTDEHYRFDIGTIMDFGDHFDIALDHAKSFEIHCYAMPDMIITIHVAGDPDDPDA